MDPLPGLWSSTNPNVYNGPMTSRVCAPLLSLVFACIVFPSVVAAEVTVSPLLVDETLKPRDIKNIPITIQNPDDRSWRLYATVNAINLDTGGEIESFVPPSMDDRTTSITSWIEISRGRIEIGPNETIEVPLTVKLNPYAKPGEYHAFIGFAAASKRHQAEAAARRGTAPGTIISITVPEDRRFQLRLDQFSVPRLLTGSGGTISYTVENPGDVPLTPRGELILYDGRGREVGATPLNIDGTAVPPGESIAFSESVPATGGLGRYKAFLRMEYGDQQVASINDTAFFYRFSTTALILGGGGFLLLVILLALLLRRAFGGSDEDDGSGDEVALFHRPGHDHPTYDHDISLKS